MYSYISNSGRISFDKSVPMLQQVDEKNYTSVLVLSTGYEPIFRTTWQRALSAVVGGRAEVIEIHEHFKIGTVNGAVPFPVKVRFKTGFFIGKINHKNRVFPKISKKNVWMRDKGICQYCLKKLSLSEATVDHVIPRSQNGSNAWTNIVLSCIACNQKKGSSLLKDCNMKLLRLPNAPEASEVLYKK
jgi:hypothetical protein